MNPLGDGLRGTSPFPFIKPSVPALEILSYIFWVLLAIMILVFVHELGHFLFAKLFRMRVDRFSVGFPPKLFGKQIGETEYMIGATPLGGYVKIAGMVDESLDTNNLASEPEPWEFRAKPIWQRIVVIVAGVCFNMLLAYGVFTSQKLLYGETYVPADNIEAVYVADSSLAYEMGLRTGDRLLAVNDQRLERYGDLLDLESLLADPMTISVLRGGDTLTFQGPPDLMTQLNRRGGSLGIAVAPSLVGGVLDGAPAAEAGLRAGDRILAIGDVPVRFWDEMTGRIQAAGGAPVAVRWLRPDSLVAGDQVLPAGARLVERRAEGAVYEAPVQPEFVAGERRYMLGVAEPTPQMLAAEFGVREQRYEVGEALVAGAAQTWGTTRSIVTSLQRVFTGRDSFRENVGGPIMIARVTKQAADAGQRVFWNIVAMLSITLAIMNILPIPALDGGHLVFLLYEAVTRREPSLKVRMWLQQIGMVLLLAFMVFVIFNDFLRL